MSDTAIRFYTVQTPTGAALGQLACTREQLDGLMAAEHPGRAFTIDDTASTVTLIPERPPMTEEEIAALDTDSTVTLLGEAWTLKHVGGYSRSRSRKVIQIEAAPTTLWAPGEPIPDKVLQRWLGEDGSLIDVDKQFLVRPDKEIVYVFGAWKPELLPQIETMLRCAAEGGFNPYVYGFREFINAVAEIKRREQQRLIERAQGLQRRIDELTAEMASSFRELRAVRRLADVAPESVDIPGVLARVAQVNGVKRLWVDGERIMFETDHIQIVNRGITYDIGTFHVGIHVVSGEIKFRNLDRQVNGYHHPHVFDNGNACLGEIAAAVPQMVSDFMLVELVNVLVRYLRSVNDQDVAGRHIVDWPKAAAPEAAAAAA